MNRPPVAIIGAGPAGFSVALWLRNLSTDFQWFDPVGRVGGTLLRVGNPIDTLTAGRSFASGIELADALEQQRESIAIEPPQTDGVSAVRADDSGGWELHFDASPPITFKQVVLATGTQPRLLGLPDESRLLGRGVEISVTRNLPRYRSSNAVVVGGGDAAAEGALLLADVCPHVWLVHRSARWRAQRRFMTELRARPNVTILEHRQVVGFHVSNSGSLTGVALDHGQSLPATGCFIRIGVAPCLPPVHAPAPASLATSSDGYVKVDEQGLTSLPGIWACGDLTGSAHQSVAWAAGQAARVAWSIAAGIDAP